MSTTTIKPPTRSVRLRMGGGARGPGYGGGGDGDGSRKPLPSKIARTGMLFALAAIAMLFVALTSAYVVRYGLDPEWRAIRMPAVLPVNTAFLLMASLTMEFARRAMRSGGNASVWLFASLGLGAAFVAGQFAAWQTLSAGGVYLSTNAHSSFFYLLTGVHGLHVAGGILALSYVAFRYRRDGYDGSAGAHVRRVFDATALYWHFMGGLWVYLLLLLFVWR